MFSQTVFSLTASQALLYALMALTIAVFVLVASRSIATTKPMLVEIGILPTHHIATPRPSIVQRALDTANRLFDRFRNWCVWFKECTQATFGKKFLIDPKPLNMKRHRGSKSMDNDDDEPKSRRGYLPPPPRPKRVLRSCIRYRVDRDEHATDEEFGCHQRLGILQLMTRLEVPYWEQNEMFLKLVKEEQEFARLSHEDQVEMMADTGKVNFWKNLDGTDTTRAPKAKKSVHFVDDDNLCSIRFFERPQRSAPAPKQPYIRNRTRELISDSDRFNIRVACQMYNSMVVSIERWEKKEGITRPEDCPPGWKDFPEEVQQAIYRKAEGNLDKVAYLLAIDYAEFR